MNDYELPSGKNSESQAEGPVMLEWIFLVDHALYKSLTQNRNFTDLYDLASWYSIDAIDENLIQG